MLQKTSKYTNKVFSKDKIEPDEKHNFVLKNKDLKLVK
jgi:hypothetical protein